jgi:hypothetical protein
MNGIVTLGRHLVRKFYWEEGKQPEREADLNHFSCGA